MSFSEVARPFVFVLVLLTLFGSGCTGDENAAESGPSGGSSDSASIPDLSSDELVAQGLINEAIVRLRAEVKKNPRDHEARGKLGHLLSTKGDQAGAIEVWSAGIRGESSDRDFHLAIGELRYHQAKHGAGPTIEGFPQNVSPEFRAKHLALARESFERAIRSAPGDTPAIRRLARTLIDLKDFESLEKLLADAVAKHPKDAVFAGQYAQTLERRGQPERALEEFRRALTLDPRMSVAHTALAKDLERRGDAKSAAAARQKAAFYRWARPSLGLEYSEATYTQYRLLAGVTGPGETLSQDEIMTRRRSAILKLLQDDTEVAKRLIANASWYHHDHDGLEPDMFAALGKSKRDIPILTALVKESKQPCVVRHALRELVELKAPEAFDLCAERLPGDNHPVSFVDAASALATLQDARAVEILTKVMNPALVQSAPGGRGDVGGAVGIRLNRIRAAFALGSFDRAEAREALRKGLESSDVELACRAALYLLDGSEEHLAAIRSAFGEGGRMEIPVLTALFLASENAALTKIAKDSAQKAQSSPGETGSATGNAPGQTGE